MGGKKDAPEKTEKGVKEEERKNPQQDSHPKI